MESVKRWQMFLIAPADLLRLLRFIRAGVPLSASPFPPDTRAVDAFFSPERGYFVIVLESEFFDPVPVVQKDGIFHGSWNELVFSLDDLDDSAARSRSEARDVLPDGPPGDDDNWQRVPASEVSPPPPLPHPPQPPAHARWEAYFVRPGQVLQLLRLLAAGAVVESVDIPTDAVLRDASYVAERESFLLLIESDTFDAVTPVEENGTVRVAIPDRFLNLD